MLKYLGWASEYPFLRTAGEIVYYGTIAGVIVAFLILAARRWLALGYPAKRVFWLAAIAIATSYPLGHLGSRGASLFYRPFHEWSFQFFIENMFHGPSHTFHASLILPLIFIALLCYLFRFRSFEVFDAIFLYMPLAHAFGRLSCLIVGCCWGQYVHLKLFGLYLGFQNPVPLWAIGVNVCIFLFLRRVYTNAYADPWTRERYRGVVFASYFALYAPARIVFEAFRTERRILFGLTHAQLAMGLFLLFALILFLIIRRRYVKKRDPAPPSPAAQSAGNELTKLFSLAGLLVSFVVLSFLIHYLTRGIRIWPWPFQPVHSLADAYARILYYLPMMLLPAYSLYWLQKSRIPIRPWLQWNRFSYAFLVGLAVSLYYCIDLLVLQQVDLRGAAFWPPVLVLSIMNAVAEEIMYRLALYNLLRRAAYSKWVANIVQALVYSLIHFMIAGALLGIFALIYGLIMGIVVQRSRSVTPAIICHFIIDLGAIGMPLLRY